VKLEIDHIKPTGTSRAVPKLLREWLNLIKVQEFQKKAKANLENFQLFLDPNVGSGSIKLHSRSKDIFTLSQISEIQQGANGLTYSLKNPGEIINLVDFHRIQASEWSHFYQHRPGAKLQVNFSRICEVSNNIEEIVLFDMTDDQILNYHELGHLFHEYYSLIEKVVQEHRAYIELCTKIYHPEKIDTRKHIRQVSFFLFKSLPDFSGCEEEVALTVSTVKPSYSFLKIRKTCYTIKHLYLPRLIPLSNLRMTG